MRRKMFVGTPVYGYSELFEKVGVLRERKANGDGVGAIGTTAISPRTARNTCGSRLVGLPHSIHSVVRCADCISLDVAKVLDGMINAGECVLMDTNETSYLKTRKYSLFDTS